jgi:hypothetical protein
VGLWWIGNLVLAVVTIILFVFEFRSMKPVGEIRMHANDIIEHGTALSRNLDAIPKLLQTQRLVGVARQGVGAYGAAITELL